MLLHVHVDRPLEPHLAVLHDDRVLVLRDAVHRTVERPVEDDARRLAAEARVVFALEVGGGFRAELGQLRPAVEARSGGGTAPRSACAATASAAPFTWLVLIERAERHEPAAGAARIDHHHLFG